MAGTDKSTGRAAAAAGVLMLSVVGLRGHLPGSANEPVIRTSSAPAALTVVVALLGIALAVVAGAVMARVRDRRAAAISVAGREEWLRAGGGATRPRWRAMVLLGVGLAAGFSALLVTAWLLLPGLGQLTVEQPSLGQSPTTQTPAGDSAPPSQPGSPHGEDSPLGYLYATTAIFLVLLVATIVITRARHRAAQPAVDRAADRTPNVPNAAPRSLTKAAERGLAEIGDLRRQPREAIIACYTAMEHELAHVPAAVPQDFDTASEVLARGVEHHALRPDSATQLVTLFTEAQFSAHDMTEDDRELAVDALRLILADLRSPT
jgi:hypothetical protein